MAEDENVEAQVAIMKENLDSFFLIVMGIVVFLMQCGFAFLEAGAVRSKNTVNILIKNMLDCLIGGVAYWAIGWGVAYGEDGNGFLGTKQFFSINMDHSKYPLWFFQYVFAATAATIVSGSIAERCNFNAYFVYSIFITGWVYPCVSHWAWAETGWLAVLGYKDFAGSGVVHILGGTCALVACVLIGPRLQRFDKDGKAVDMPGHSVPLAGLGGFILLFGFLAFNGGSQLSITNEHDAEKVGLAIVNTIIGGCGGGLTVLFLVWAFIKKWSYLLTLNGALAGMVSMCAGCNVFEPWAALLIGLMAGFVFIGIHTLMLRFKQDDPLDAVAVHLGSGVLGVLAVPFFSYGDGIFWMGNTMAPWHLLGVNLAGVVSIFLWAAFCSGLIFGSLKFFNQLRIDSTTEFKGCDRVKHGESAYPVDAWVEGQYTQQPSILTVMTGESIENGSVKAYNDAIKFLPAVGKLSVKSRETFGVVPLASVPTMNSPPIMSRHDNKAFEVNE